MKKMHGYILPVLMALCILPQHVCAEEYTLNDLYRIALERSEAIRMAREDINFSELEKSRAYSALLPKLSAFASYQRFTEEVYNTAETQGFIYEVLAQPESSRAWGLRADETLSLSLREVTGVRIAKNGIIRSRHDLNALLETYLLQVAEAYYNVLKAKKGLDIAQSNLDRVTKYRDAAQSRLRVGEITKTVLLRAESELSGTRSDLVKAQNALSLSYAYLARLAGIETGFTLKDEQLREENAASLPELKDIAYEHRPDLKSLKTQVRMAEQQVWFARGAYWPNITLSGVYARTDWDPQSNAISPESAYGAVSLSFPFYEGGLRRAEVLQAKVRERQAVLRYENLKKSVGLDVEKAYLDLMTRKGTLAFLDNQVAFARDNYRGVSRQFLLGQASSIDVIDANNLLVSSERQLAEAMYSYQLAILALEQATGTFMKETPEETKAKSK